MKSSQRARLSARAVLMDHKGRVLLVQHRFVPPTLKGCWSLPGGQVEPGESPEEALRRELFEELDILVHDLSFVAAWPWGGRLHLIFTVFPPSDAYSIASEEIEEARWFSADELKELEADGLLHTGFERRTAERAKQQRIQRLEESSRTRKGGNQYVYAG